MSDDWSGELEELARRRSARGADGRRGEGREAPIAREAAGPRAHRAPARRRQLPRDRLAHRPRDVRRRRSARRPHARQLRDGSRAHRRTHGRRRRGRLHRPGRIGRRVDLPEAGARGAHGARSAPADRPARRRFGWRRFGEDARAGAPFVRAVQPGLGVGRRQPLDRTRRLAVPRFGRGARRGAGRDEPLQRDGEGDVAPLRRRSAGRRRSSAKTSTRRRSAAARSTRATASSTTKRETEAEAIARAARVPLLPSVVGARATAAHGARRPTIRPSAATSGSSARSRASGARSTGPADHRGGRRPRLVHGARSPLRWPRRHRARATRRLAGRGPRQRSVPLRRWLDRGRGAEGHPLRRPRRHVRACRSCTSSTTPGSSSASRPSTRRRSATAPARSRRSTRPRCRGAR